MTLYIGTVNNFLLIFRFALCTLPYFGYIHPDQFMQNQEVMAGFSLHYNVTYTWEWSGASPARSVMFPLITSGIPYIIMALIANALNARIPPILLLMIPKLVATAIMSICDALVTKMAKMYTSERNQSADIVLFLWRSSYLTLIMFSLNFSNCLEVLLQGLLLLVITPVSYIDGKTETQYTTFFLDTGVILALGFFVRPSFVVFACYPLAVTMYKELEKVLLSRKIWECILNATIFFCSALLVSFLCVILDSLFHANTVSPHVLTPINFMRYNLNVNNLQLHGIHPRYLHLVVNLPLLFGPAYLLLPRLHFSCKTRIYANQSRSTYFTTGAMEFHLLGTFFTPVLLLSMFAHQEPRFLWPTLIPMTLIIGRFFVTMSSMGRKLFLVCWLIFNASMAILFGYLHQGGLIPCLLHLNKVIYPSTSSMSSSEIRLDHHIVFWKTYIIPRHLLQISNKQDFNKKIRVYDLMGAPEQDMLQLVYHLKQSACLQREKQLKMKIHLAMPSTVWQNQIVCKDKKFFTPHLSLEDPPWSTNSFHGSSQSMWEKITHLPQSLSLVLCEISNDCPTL